MYGDMTESEVKELYDEAAGKSPEPAWRTRARHYARAARQKHKGAA